MRILRQRGALRQSFTKGGLVALAMKLSPQEIINRADALYDARGQLENLRASVELLQSDECANDYEAAWRLGRALFFLGQEAGSKVEARAYHARGAAACERAARLKPSRVEGHFWLGVNLALLARLENSFKALGHALRARRFLQRAVRLNPSYHAAGPLRVLARLQHKLPMLFGGGTKRARANFERAINLAPANTVTRLYFAELLMEIGDKTRARKELESILDAPPDPAWAFESARDRDIAREMLKKAKGKSEEKPI
ncbi:MAG TPA: TRAP transporter TatT component family protein [Pyrinomonadaceae bacterium]|nr:TRAP transporter TatT component family protein [Pyrinomonadaceae bacterium]